jgi:hypothetical protein
MKIADVEPILAGNPSKAWFFIHARTDEWIIRVGEHWLAAHTRPEIGLSTALRAAAGLLLKARLGCNSLGVPTLANMIVRNFFERYTHAFICVSIMSPKLSSFDLENQHVFNIVAEWYQQCCWLSNDSYPYG